MTAEYITWGEQLNSEDNKQIPELLRTFSAFCDEHTACDIIGFTQHENPSQYSVILDVGDGTFELDNQAGILRNERIAVTYKPAEELCWEVRPLRSDFPTTIHQNHVLEGEPRSLCLYIENWKVVERTWTPESFLQRILWWLRSAANGTIHADDQPIEQLFFDSPICIQLPPDHDEKSICPDYRLLFTSIQPDKINRMTLRGQYILHSEIDESKTPTCIPISLTLSPIENGPVEQYPSSLGGLQDLVESRGADLLKPLKAIIEERATQGGLSESTSSEIRFILVIVAIPRTRKGNVEKTELLGFAIKSGLGELGVSLGTLYKSVIPGDDKWYVDTKIAGSNAPESSNWRHLLLDLVRVTPFPTEQDIRRYSGLDQHDVGPKGVIAGVGALGSTIAQLWKREAWGQWHFVDSDIIEAHNVVRHIAPHGAIGRPKTQITRLITDNIYEHYNAVNQDYIGSITDKNPDLQNIISDAEILVDVTTTLYAPRDLAEREDVPRVASIFFTPSGSASVLLLEDQQRQIRSNQLEAQYYRSILNSDWGKSHLDGNHSQFWVGAGCRDVSVALSYEIVQLHGATLARQLRKAVSNERARITIWDYDEDTGGITPHDIPVATSRTTRLGDWTIIWDLIFEKTIKAERSTRLPNETGGMLLGIVDHKTKTITLVDWTSQPPGSTATPGTFIRGTEGQAELINECQRRTAGIVSYIGEWHSHPPQCSAKPSTDDKKQLTSITDEFYISSTTPIMMIVASDTIEVCMVQGDTILVS